MDKSTRPLIVTWLVLLVLLLATAGAALLPLGWLNTVVSFVIALAKAVLVMLVFMRLRRAPAVLRIAAITGATALVILFALSTADYATRPELPAPWQQPSTVMPTFGSR